MSVQEDNELRILRQLRQMPELLDEVRRSPLTEFQLQDRLRARFPGDLVRGALSLQELRVRGRSKFSRADAMWFERTSLEQATTEVVAIHKSHRFRGLTGGVVDLCCGIGSDSISIAQQGCNVLAVDRSPAMLLRAEWNAEVYGVAGKLTTRCDDVRNVSVTGQIVHIDPDRRTGPDRALRLEDYEPPLEFLQQLTQSARGGAIKLSPASNFGGKFPGCEIELISLHGECKEATVWFGDLKSSTDWRATLLPENVTLEGDPWLARGEVGPLGRFLYDPDPAVVRAGLIDVLAERDHFQRLDPAEEYLTSDDLIESPFVRAFEVVENLPFDEKDLKIWFRQHPCGELEIKCRHISVSAEKLRKKLPLEGNDRLTLLIARIDGKARGVIARRLSGGLQNPD